ncbi:hypothetical protein D8B26_005505 [Coccidioides posadasii str. Silveira]|uniref:uncharacterized protein n=1 Tax=Coccidioides posadasii (strain RMSCC 757 / Silveira) TaxID=443226 RepID=UPI001BF1554C|nr:hypothetical protein D8B26_005505 [Coccidioides posadasii str. Silveira]
MPIKAAFAPRNIPFCIVNEAALNYYNVPVSSIKFLEICVPEHNLSAAASQIASYTDIFRRFPRPEEAHRNLYTDYKKPYPRFQAFIEGRNLGVIVFPDTFYHLDPLQDNIVQIEAYSAGRIRFSRQFDYSIGLNALASIPVPRLATLLQESAQRYLESMSMPWQYVQSN